ncbi:hypothetical protein [Niallia sp. BSM11]
MEAENGDFSVKGNYASKDEIGDLKRNCILACSYCVQLFWTACGDCL